MFHTLKNHISVFLISLTLCLSVHANLCENYLSSDLKLSDSYGFNLSLGKIHDSESFSDFVSKFYNVYGSLTLNNKKTFVRSGLIELEKLSIPYLESLNLEVREKLLRLFSRNSHRKISLEFFVKLQEVTKNDLADMEAQDLASFIYLMGKLSLRPDVDLLIEIQKEVSRKIQEFDSKMMSNVIFGFGLLGVKPNDNFLNSWRERYKVIYLTFDKVSLVNSIFAFYLMNSHEMVKWFAGATPESKWDEIKKKDHIERRQVSLVFEYFFRVHNHVIKPIERFRGHFKDLIKASDRQTSKIEELYEMRLAISGLDYEMEYQTEPGFFVDFYLPEKNKVIQIDGPTHFVRQIVDGQFVEYQRPHDLLIDEILRSYGYVTARVSYKKILPD